MQCPAVALAPDPTQDANDLRSLLQQKEAELKQLQDSFDEYTQSSQELEQALEDELARAERQHQVLSAKVSALSDELARTRELLDKTQQALSQCEADVEALRKALGEVSSQKRQLEQETDDLATRVRILEATDADLRHRVEREVEEKVFLAHDQEDLKREHALVTARLRTEIVDLKSEVVALVERNDRLKREREREQEMARARTISCASSAETSVSVSGGRNNTEGRLELKRTNESMAMEVEMLEEKGETQTTTTRTRRRASTLVERDADDREHLIKTLRGEIAALTVQLQEETQTRERLTRDVAEARNEAMKCTAMESEMKELGEEVTDKTSRLREREEEVLKLGTQVQTLTNEVTRLQQEKKAQEAEIANQCDNNELDALTERVAALEAENETFEQRVETEQQVQARLKAKIQVLTEQLEQNTKLRHELEQELEFQAKTSQQNMKQLKQDYKTLQKELEVASQRAADLELASSNSSTSVESLAEMSSSQPNGWLSKSNVSNMSTTSTSADQRRYLLEIQSLRAKISSLQAENVRLRGQESSITSALLPNKRVSSDLLTFNFTSEQLARKYLSERTRNAALLSRLQTVCGNIQVFCRVRPVIPCELESSLGTHLSVNVINQSDVAVLDVRPDRVFPDGLDAEAVQNKAELIPEAFETNAAWKVFTFDRVIGPEESQVDVFREVEPVAQAVVEGYKACIFAYGQTGSGKTHTMEGVESDPGLNYRIVSHMFQSIVLRGSVYNPDRMEEDQLEAEIFAGEDAGPMEPCYHIQVGVLEIYNETLRDLVNPSNPNSLEIRQDPLTGDIVVPELTMSTVSSTEQTIELLRDAQMNRATGRTDMNAHSSRSHSIVIIQLSTRTSAGAHQSDDGMMDSYVSGKLYLVDLAGSERVKKSNVSGVMLREAAHINKSLSALADVMEALDKKLQHVPYRNSKLTYLLQDVLNSSCKTVMIVNVGPTLDSASETFRSLALAERVRNIVVGRNSIVQNKKDIVSAKKAYAEIQALKRQIKLSERKVKQSQQAVVSLKREKKSQSDHLSSAMHNKVKAAERETNQLRAQLEALKKANAELSIQVKQERDAKQKEAEQREAVQKSLRQLNSATRVNSSQQEALQRQLQDREDEIKKLRRMLSEARQRTALSVIPRHKGTAASGPAAAPASAPHRMSGAATRHSFESELSNQQEQQVEEPMTSVRRLSMKFGLFGGRSHRHSDKQPASQKSDTSAGNAAKFRRVNSSGATAVPSSQQRPGWK